MTVLVLVLVLVLGGDVVVVVVVVVVVGDVVVVVVAGDSVVVLGAPVSVTVCVPAVGAGATDSDSADVVGVVVVVDVGLDESPPVSETIAKTINPIKIAPKAPSVTRPAGLRYHGAGGSGACSWP